MEYTAIAACSSYEEEQVRKSLSGVLSSIGGLDFVKPGMKIAIKANLVTGAPPEKAVVTHPVMLAELTRMLKERGAEVVVGDSPGGPFTQGYLRKVYKESKLEPAVKAGAMLNEDVGTVEVSNPAGTVLKQFYYTSWLKEADAIICFCKLKTHGMMRLSANAKNMYGAIPGTMKPEYHYRFPEHETFADMILDINEYLKPCLYITDAVLVMEGNGPTAGHARFLGAVLASKKPYDLDVVCAHLIGQDPMQVPTIAASVRRGFTTGRIEDVPLLGDPEPYVLKDFDRIEQADTITFASRIPGFLMPVVMKILQPKPQVTKSECIGCRKCENVCPAKAITMVNKKPVIDRNVCIRCFCCQEFCPKGAMKVHRSALARSLQKQ